jgi:hypothetical protein
MRKTLIPTAIYLFVSGVTIAIGITLWNFFDARTYQVVTLFICLIILSNCFAKLFTLHIFKDPI